MYGAKHTLKGEMVGSIPTWTVGARSSIGRAENATSKLYVSHTAMLIWLENPTVVGSSPIVRRNLGTYSILTFLAE